MTKKTVAILIFDDVEVLDFAGPFEVFSVTNELNDYKLLNIYTVSQTKAPITARNGLSINPDYALREAPEPNLLIIPGGSGTRLLLNQPNVIQWIQASAKQAEKVLSVCSGALLLAQAGLLDGLEATTHHEVFNTLAELSPTTTILKTQRFVDNGKVITAAGISAGIDMSLYVVTLIYGEEISHKTATYMEYPYDTKRDHRKSPL